MKDNFSVKSIPFQETWEWVLKKHYAKRIPPISYAFGLYEYDRLNGVCTFGNNGGCTQGNYIGNYQVIELNRLCIDSIEKNITSYFVSKCLKLLPIEYIIVSYADIDQSHIGYIYQATNWTYTGISKGDVTLYKNGKSVHRKSFYDKYGRCDREYIMSKGYEIINQKGKHRYFYMTGNKKMRKDKLKSIQYPILPYPKGETKRYDASYKPITQGVLF